MLYFILNIIKIYSGINTGMFLIRIGVNCILTGIKLLIT